MDYNTLLSKRLKIILDDVFSGNYSAMSRAIGVSDKGLSSYIRGTRLKDGSFRLSTPSAEVVANIISKLEIYPEWILFGKGKMKKKDNQEDVVNEPIGEYSLSKERLFRLIESQQETIVAQSKSIENLSKRGIATAEDVDTARVRKGS
ncbi:MAG: hypothetical protein PHQ67_09365 [Fermentimonas sp.]|nr:hypothetical protein [Fermentimonas sp.]MDD4438961.1 hypothetical protein [Tissierellia bacterium]